MKNTKLTFYCTQCQQGIFEKIIFEIVLEGVWFKDLSDAKEWLNDPTIEAIYRDFDLDIVFDWVIMNYSITSEAPRPICDIKRIEGRLSFTQKRVLKAKAELEGKPAPPPPRKEYRSCWIEPSGKTHWVGFAMHNEYAADWLERHDNIKYKKIMESWGRYHYEELEDRGWIKILGWTDPPRFVLPDKIGPKLKQSLREYCMSQNVSYESWPDTLKS